MTTKHYCLFFILFFCVIAVEQVRAEDGSKTVLRILCYNIQHGRGMDNAVNLTRTANVIKEWKPDLVAVQEVDRNTQRTDGVDQAKILAELLGMHYVFGKAIDYQGGDYGILILSRFPILEHQMVLLPPEEAPQEKRGVLVARIGIPDSKGKIIRFACTHMSTVQSERLEQIDKIDAVLSEGSEPTILAGDINARPTNGVITRFLPNWTDTAAPTLGKHVTPDRPDRIDYIFFRKKDPFDVLESRTINDTITSDHKPIFSILSL
jgi:endonuclease/exonuclease/phosphatase family metal-dependent hydrolase